MRHHTIIVLNAAMGLLIAATACTTASQGPAPAPQLDRPGEFMVRYQDAELSVIVDFTFAAHNPGAQWLLLNVSMTGSRRVATEVHRDHIFAITPSGERLGLPTQREFANAYPEVQGLIRRANLANEPLSYVGADRRRCRLAFFAVPGAALRDVAAGTATDTMYISKSRFCSGPLYFRVGAGVQPGGWLLGIERDETTIRIPFVLPSTTG